MSVNADTGYRFCCLYSSLCSVDCTNDASKAADSGTDSEPKPPGVTPRFVLCLILTGSSFVHILLSFLVMCRHRVSVPSSRRGKCGIVIFSDVTLKELHS